MPLYITAVKTNLYAECKHYYSCQESRNFAFTSDHRFT